MASSPHQRMLLCAGFQHVACCAEFTPRLIVKPHSVLESLNEGAGRELSCEDAHISTSEG